MRFLEFFAHEMLGPPVRHSWGDPHWICPGCESDNLHMMPEKEGKKDRYKCFRCGTAQDPEGLYGLLEPESRFPEQRAKVYDVYLEYKKVKRRLGDSFSPRGYDVAIMQRIPEKGELENAAIDWDAMNEDEETSHVFALQILNNAKEVCGSREMTIDSLVKHLNDREDERVQFQKWIEETDARHLAECTDKCCSAAVCRRAGGWTEKEIQADIKRRKELRRKLSAKGWSHKQICDRLAKIRKHKDKRRWDV